MSNNRMYLERDNSGYGILITDGQNWWYYHEAHLPVNLTAETDEGNAGIIRLAVARGELYNADDFVSEAETDHIITAYDGMTLEEIDKYENNDRSCDFTKYIEI